MPKTISTFARCIVIVVTMTCTSLSQIPSLENAVSVPLGVSSSTSDGYGQHLVGVFNGIVKHFLVGNDGAIIYQDRLAVSGGEFPIVTSSGGKLRVTMKLNNNIAVYQSTDGGASWPSSFFPSPPISVSIFDIDASSDGFGTHIVWATGSVLGNNEVYYVMLNYQSPPSFGTLKNVTDLPAQEYGYRPKISNSISRAHVQFITPNQQMYSRDLLLPNTWADNYVVSSVASASAVSSTTTSWQTSNRLFCLVAQWPYYNGSQQLQDFYLTSKRSDRGELE